MALVKVVKILPYTLYAQNGRRIRVASKAILEDGSEVKFTEKLSKNEAIILLTFNKVMPVKEYSQDDIDAFYSCYPAD